uniref:Uncharacterized protein n=1 Tax=Arundo donax TaxID=35708 RepID=A0A0A9EKW7_ARUDO
MRKAGERLTLQSCTSQQERSTHTFLFWRWWRGSFFLQESRMSQRFLTPTSLAPPQVTGVGEEGNGTAGGAGEGGSFDSTSA